MPQPSESTSLITGLITGRREFIMLSGTSAFATAATFGLSQLASSAVAAQEINETNLAHTDSAKSTSVAVVWKDNIQRGAVEVTYGALQGFNHQAKDAESKSPADFRLKTDTKRLEIQIDDVRLGPGAKPTRITITWVSDSDSQVKENSPKQSGFTFFLRDVMPNAPIFVPGLNAAVVTANDKRTYAEIEAAVQAKKLKSDSDLINIAPEETYKGACDGTKSMRCPTWLGVGRDMRIFRVMPLDSTGYWGYVEPYDLVRSSLGDENLPAKGRAEPNRYTFILGRGAGCRIDIERHLEDSIPIIKSTQRDGDMEYQLTIFATLEKEPLTSDNVRGTHWLASFANATGAMLTKEEQKEYQEIKNAEVTHREQELICWVHIDAINRAAVPRYAYIKSGYIKADALEGVGSAKFDDGMRILPSKNVMAINQLNGQPMPQEEMAILVQPGEKITFDIRFPHRPLTRDRAVAVREQNYEAHYKACRAFWQQKLKRGAQISLPEVAVEERVRAGLLHLDILTLGMAKEGPLATSVGWYAPIGSESSPIIQFYDSLGYHELAERAIDFFLNRQREDGFIQTCLGYQLETGPLLWTMGEHFRYTRDVEWAKRVLPNVKKACKFLLDWRERNKNEKLRGRGYGLLEGKVADPQDFYHSYMLNGLTYVGLKRAVEMYKTVDPKALADVEKELASYLADIRESYKDNVARSPVIPLGDGSWVPSFSPWAEYAGPVSLYADGGSWLSHFMFASRDSLIGSLFLGIGEVLDPNEPLSTWLLHAHQELMTNRNAGLSQPYYCRHDWLHLKRGEVKEFLKTYYNQFTSLQDRETYTFWEHYVGVGESQHKTHEEAWFLMQSRWMLWDEDYDTRSIKLLPMIPRQWLEAGKEIKLEKCASYFGPFSLNVRASQPLGTIEATVTFHGPAANHPKTVLLRLPHPMGKKPSGVNGGKFDAKTESLEFKPNGTETKISLRYS